MQLRTIIQFTEPSDIPVTITLTGSLAGFERLVQALTDAEVPLYEVDDLVYKIGEATRQLRNRITVAMVPEKPEKEDPSK